MHPLLPALVASIAVVLCVGALARRLRQPHVIAYLIVGIVLGPSGFALFDGDSVSLVGDMGVILLLFFVGMEVDLHKLVTGWRVSVIGTLLQILLSVLVVAVLGSYYDWPFPLIILLGFAISLSSTTLVVTMLRQWKEMDTEAGQDAIGVILVQDVALAPMLITIGFLGGTNPEASLLATQLLGGVAVLWLVTVLVKRTSVKLPFRGLLRLDHEFQIFGALFLCFSFAWLSGVCGLSTALGAFLAGLVVARARETDWVHHSLEPYRVLFVAAFFVSIGMLVDLGAMAEHWQEIAALILLALGTNTLVNAAILRAFRRSWGTSFYAGALLSQIGEFSFVLAAVGLDFGIITSEGHQLVLGVIVGTLLLGPAWIGILRPLRGPGARIDDASTDESAVTQPASAG